MNAPRPLLLLFVCATLAVAAPAHAQLTRPRIVAEGEIAPIVGAALAEIPGRVSSAQWARQAYEGLRREGWLWAELRLSAAADTIFVAAGQRARLGQIQVRGADSLLVAEFLRGGDLFSGRPYRPIEWEARCHRGLARLGERGHPFARVATLEMSSQAETASVDLSLLLMPGKRARVSGVTVSGAVHTDEDVIARFAGISTGVEFRESLLERARERLLAREIILDVPSIAPRLAVSDGSEVEIHIDVRQPAKTGRLAAALGLIRNDGDEGTRVFGSLDLALLDLLGTARQLHARFHDDGESRRRLDISYLEPMLFDSPLDLNLELGQRHQDESYDTVMAEASLRLPWRGQRRLELGVGADRTSFIGDEGRLRVRQRLTAALGLARRQPSELGIFGALQTRLEGARVEETLSNPAAGQAAARTEHQTILEADGRLALAFSRRLALALRGSWASVSTDDLPIPESEQYFLGGATSVRGHREDELHGEKISHGGAELILGRAESGQAYVFYDLGFRRLTVEEEGRLRGREKWIRGFGMGVRAAAAFGRIDLSLGFARELSFDSGLVHLSLIQEF